jgi:solute carrier family 25 carnitine/acylcarnitine transporter 20/29
MEMIGEKLIKHSFWSYEWMKHTWTTPDDSDREAALKVLLCGGLAGIWTWASIFPLDVIKTRVQTQLVNEDASRVSERRALLEPDTRRARLNAIALARQAYRTEGAGVFFRGLGVCSVRAFIVNAVQWAVYEWMMRLLQSP